MTYGSDPITVSLQISTDDKVTWTEWDGHIVYLNNGEKMYVKALNDNTDGCNGHKFVMEGQIAASGNIQYLLTSDGSRTDVPPYGYMNLFYNCNSLIQASELELPADTLSECSYAGMFFYCMSLVNGPKEIKATTLAERCCINMFCGCTNLKNAPKLLATTLAPSCYNGMLSVCSSLEKAPDFIATTLANLCYFAIFIGTDQLTECHMKSNMEGVYDPEIHGDTTETVIYDL